MEGPVDKNNDLFININSIQKNCPISPPTPITPPSSHKLSTYSLFDHQAYRHWDWLSRNNTVFRNTQNNKDLSSSFTQLIDSEWRLTSLMNGCTLCLNKQVQLYSPSCGQHTLCQPCLGPQNLHFIVQGICPVCVQTNIINETNARQIIATSNINNDYHSFNLSNSNSLRNYSNNTTNNNSTNHALIIYPCVKLTNIPWDVSQNDIRHFFGNCRFPSPNTCIQSIHIMMDRTTGKTLSDAYIEFATISDMRRAIETRNQKPLKGRIVSVSECTSEEFLMVVFPKWRGQFQGISAIPPTTEVVRTMSTAAGGGNSGCPPFITREEINSLLVVCKNYKLHFSRKCAERPFENIISVIAKYPWHQTHLISTMHRDHIYEMLKLSIESIKTHLAKDYVQIDSTLLERLTRAGIMCPAFTERQKMTLLQTARIECPSDILSYLIPHQPIPTHLVYNPTKQPKQLKKSNPWEEPSDAFSSFDTISSLMKEMENESDWPTENDPRSMSTKKTQQKLSPWAPTFESKLPSDIWRMNTTVESNVSSKSLLAA